MSGNFIFYLAAFAVALGVLIVVHELGHFLVARLCGIKVLRFSVGFGRVLLARCYGADRTEWVISAFPLGGYVRMLDEREAPVAEHELGRAFNRQAIWKRILVVGAGPAANLLLALLLYWVLFMHGMEELRPILAAPPAATVAARAGVEEGETVRSINGKSVLTWQELRWELLQAALDRTPTKLEVINSRQEISDRNLDLQDITEADLDADLPPRLGLKPYRPRLQPIIGVVSPGSVAEQAGLRGGDEVVSIDGQSIQSWNEVAARIRSAAGTALQLELRRGAEHVNLQVTPVAAMDGNQSVGRIGIMAREDPALRAQLTVVVQYPVLTALSKACAQTWSMSTFSLKMIGRMLIGDVSWKNLSGPVTIADYAGQSARLGLPYYLKFLALISISLGVLNLLPIPILDGGHLLYYMVEIIKGGPLSERVMEIGQKIGLSLLMILMALAFYNDINRFVSG
ncbi:MAG: RIP metalloprotease RseP [Betaproteobacteria bacterium]|nr:RIP metalloprotease RseP [Betaproteobacteria bacterium]